MFSPTMLNQTFVLLNTAFFKVAMSDDDCEVHPEE